jgi:hypothetical protein
LVGLIGLPSSVSVLLVSAGVGDRVTGRGSIGEGRR